MDSIGGNRYSCIVPPATAAEFWSVTSPVMAPLPAMEHPQCGVQNDPYPPTAFHSCYAGKTRVFARGISGLIKITNLYLIFKNCDSLLLFFSPFFKPFLSRVTYLHLSHITSHDITSISWFHFLQLHRVFSSFQSECHATVGTFSSHVSAHGGYQFCCTQ